MHINTKDITGQKFGRLIVVRWVGSRGHRALWLCLCECGGEKVISGKNLCAKGRDKTLSCGCLRNENRRNVGLKFRKYDNTLIGSLYSIYRNTAKRRRRAFELTFEAFQSLVTKPCHYCGDPGEWRTNGSQQYTAFVNGIDRVDNSGGYTLDNVVPCCKRCNASKHARPVSVFLSKRKGATVATV